jgi:integrase
MSRSNRNPVYERAPGVFYIRYADAEHHIRRERTSWAKLKKAGIEVKESTKLEQPGRALAQRLLNARRAECDRGEKQAALHSRRVTFGELCDAAIIHTKAHNRGAATDKGRIEKLKQKFGYYAADSISPVEITAWLNSNADWSPATRNRYRSSVSLIFRLAIKGHKAKENPARLLERYKESKGRIRFLNQYSPLPTELDYLKNCKDEESRLRAVIGKRYPWHMEEFLISLNCGLRPSEMYRLSWDKVDFARKQIFVDATKTGENRHVPLNTEALGAFRQLYARPIRKDRVFLTKDGQPLLGYKHWFDDAVAEAGLANFTWYALRHTFASRLVMAHVDLRAVQVLMGHSNVAMTVRYSHLAEPHLRDAVTRLVTTDFPGPSDTDTSTDTALAETGRTKVESVTVQ